jgi:hypothetical protein
MWSLDIEGNDHRLNVPESRLLRIRRAQRNEMKGCWKKLHKLYFSPNIFRMVKLRKFR